MLKLGCKNKSILNQFCRSAEKKFFCEGAAKTALANNERNGISELSNYTPAEEDHILSILNTKEINELCKLGISKARAGKLHSYRATYGSFGGLNDLLKVSGFNEKVVGKCCQDLLGNKPKDITKKLRKHTFVLPPAGTIQKKHVRSCVAINVNVSNITSTRLELNTVHNSASMSNLTYWNVHHTPDKKLHLHELVEHCANVENEIPMGDCYIFEDSPAAFVASSAGKADTTNINLQRAQITAMLSYALNTRRDSLESYPNVFFMRRFLSARLFNLIVGNERITSRMALNELLMANEVRFSDHNLKIYEQSGSSEKEFLGQTLLLNLAFIRLVLLEDEASITKISRSSQKTFK